MKAEFGYIGAKIKLNIVNSSGAECGVKGVLVNGSKVDTTITDKLTGRKLFKIPDNMLKSGTTADVTVEL